MAQCFATRLRPPGRSPLSRHTVKTSSYMVITARDQVRSTGRKERKWEKDKLTAGDYEEGRRYKKEKKLERRAQGRNGWEPPHPAPGPTTVFPSWTNSLR